MRLAMLARPLARVVEHGRRQCWPAERIVVAHPDPYSTGVTLAFGEEEERGVIPMQWLGAKHVVESAGKS